MLFIDDITKNWMSSAITYLPDGTYSLYKLKQTLKQINNNNNNNSLFLKTTHLKILNAFHNFRKTRYIQ